MLSRVRVVTYRIARLVSSPLSSLQYDTRRATSRVASRARVGRSRIYPRQVDVVGRRRASALNVAPRPRPRPRPRARAALSRVLHARTLGHRHRRRARLRRRALAPQPPRVVHSPNVRERVRTLTPPAPVARGAQTVRASTARVNFFLDASSASTNSGYSARRQDTLGFAPSPDVAEDGFRVESPGGAGASFAASFPSAADGSNRGRATSLSSLTYDWHAPGATGYRSGTSNILASCSTADVACPNAADALTGSRGNANDAPPPPPPPPNSENGDDEFDVEPSSSPPFPPPSGRASSSACARSSGTPAMDGGFILAVAVAAA
eukprot:31436-Pelagococcus_subviridis.AAC.2